jgi:hypothetical protein
MPIKINEKGFNQVNSLISDLIFKLESNKQSTPDLQKLKLLEARHNNPDFETELALFICGDDDDFPYRSSYFLTKFFTDLGLNYKHVAITRRFWVKDVLLELEISKLSLVLHKGLFNQRDFRKYAKEKNLDFDKTFKKAVKEFKQLIEDSIEIEDGIDLSYLLDLNINLELLFDKKIITKDNELDLLISEAKERFYNPKDKQIAVEKIWDAFERMKTYFSSKKKESSEKLVKISSNNFSFALIEDEFKLLTKLGNDYRIRHHETNKLEIKNPKHIEYLFFRMLSLIDLCLKSINEQ